MFLLATALAGVLPARSQIPTEAKLLVDFSDVKTVRQNAEWREANGLDITRNGLGFDGPKPGTLSTANQVLTCPLAVGLAWRPANYVAVTVTVKFVPWSDEMVNWHLHSSEGDTMFVRHSPDRKHWSSWQELEAVDPPKKGEDFLTFHGNVGVPRKDQVRYEKLCLEYQRMDVPWKSDEEAVVRWIVGREPGFFDKETPFVGYVQFLYETTLTSGVRLRSVEAQADATLSGLAMIPKNGDEKDRLDVPWRYVAP